MTHPNVPALREAILRRRLDIHHLVTHEDPAAIMSEHDYSNHIDVYITVKYHSPNNWDLMSKYSVYTSLGEVCHTLVFATALSPNSLRTSDLRYYVSELHKHLWDAVTRHGFVHEQDSRTDPLINVYMTREFRSPATGATITCRASDSGPYRVELSERIL